MTRLRVWMSRAAGLILRGRRDRVLQAEIRDHLDALTRDFEARGLSPADARRAARRAFGGVERTRDAYHAQGSLPFVEAIGHDLRFAVRMLLRRPGFTGLAVLALALGIGVNSTFFTLVNAICLRGLPIHQPDRVMAVTTSDAGGRGGLMSYADFVSVRDESTAFMGLAAHRPVTVTLGDEERAPDRVNAAYVSADAFSLLGVAAARGRGFAPDDDRPGAARVCLLSDLVWQTRYGADAALIGRAVKIDEEPTRVIGVMPPGFRFPATADIWLPLAARPGVSVEKRDARGLSVFGRLLDAASPADARAGLDALATALAARYPDTNRGLRFVAAPINDTVNGNVRDTVWVAFITVGVIVLLVACANVANLLLMGSLTRSHEIAVRASIGATRARIVRQLLVESAVLAALGGAAGLALSAGATRAIAAMVPPSNALPYWIEFTIDGRVLAALAAMCTVTVLVCGLAPAFYASRTRLTDAFSPQGRSGAAAFRMRKWTATFLAIEFALCFVLLASVARQVRDVMTQSSLAGSVDTRALLVGSLSLPARRYPTPASRDDFYTRVEVQFRGVPGIQFVTFASHAPSGGVSMRRFEIEGQTSADGAAARDVPSVAIGPEYFHTLGVSLVKGREFLDRDGRPGAETVIVNAPFAAAYFGSGDPIGHRLRLVSTTETAAPGPWLTIVGVAPGIRQRASVVAEPLVYAPYRASPPASMVMLARAAVPNPAILVPALRDAVREIDSDLPLYRVMPVEQAAREMSWNGRVSERILYSVSAIAFVLALVGLYAVTSHTVVQRTSEIGLRLALGAMPRQMAWLVLRRVFVQLGAGLLLGVIFSRAFETRFGSPASATDASVTVGLLALIVLVAIAACAVPVVRAARVDPLTALRRE
jgi:putative ABC transport system permease protein